MINEINKLFDMLSWNNSEEIQRKGVEEGIKVQDISVFIQPLTENRGKDIWENCAKIIAQKSDEELVPYLKSILEWLQDENWPGFYIIYSRLKTMQENLIYNAYSSCLNKAIEQNNRMWLIYLAGLAKNRNLYSKLSQTQKDIVDSNTRVHLNPIIVILVTVLHISITERI